MIYNATKLTGMTLVWYGEGKYPMPRGNCFSVATEEGETLRIVNFGAENWQEMLKREKIELPIKVKKIYGKTAIVFDERIPPEWYDDHWCEVCCVDEHLPISQKIQMELSLARGQTEKLGGGCVRHHGDKAPDFRTDEEIKTQEEARKKWAKNLVVTESIGMSVANPDAITKIQFKS